VTLTSNTLKIKEIITCGSQKFWKFKQLWGKVIIENRIEKLKDFEIACKNHL
jgi:hypothetical protein